MPQEQKNKACWETNTTCWQRYVSAGGKKLLTVLSEAVHKQHEMFFFWKRIMSLHRMRLHIINNSVRFIISLWAASKHVVTKHVSKKILKKTFMKSPTLHSNTLVTTHNNPASKQLVLHKRTKLFKKYKNVVEYWFCNRNS